MRYTILLMFLLVLLSSCINQRTKEREPEITTVAAFEGLQVTGVTVTAQGRIFANFPRWREGIPYSVVEINPDDGSWFPYPDAETNSWKAGDSITDSIFVAVQSVVAFEGALYVLDTRNPFFRGVFGAPHIFVYDLTDNSLKRIYTLDESTFKTGSYINDLRVDKKNGKVYFTDSGEAGLVILDLATGESRRILDNHYSTLADRDHLLINGKRWENTVHSDGIALDTENDKLFYHSLTGYTLYAIDTRLLSESDEEIAQGVQFVAETPAPDGMIFDNTGNLYMADLENHKIVYLTPEGELKTLIEGEEVKWADTFSIHDGYLYYTNSRIHEAGRDVGDLTFTIKKVKLGSP